MKKYIISSFISLALILSFFNSSILAQAHSSQQSLQYLSNGCYYETIITDNDTIVAMPYSDVKYITKTKTTRYKTASGKIMWSVSITATFSYNGSSSKCINCTPSAASYDENWEINHVTSNKFNNSATATAYVTQSNTMTQISKTVILKCSADGTVS